MVTSVRLDNPSRWACKIHSTYITNLKISNFKKVSTNGGQHRKSTHKNIDNNQLQMVPSRQNELISCITYLPYLFI